MTDQPTSSVPTPSPADAPSDAGVETARPQLTVNPAPVSSISPADHAAALASIESLQAQLSSVQSAAKQRAADSAAHDHATHVRTLEEQVTLMQVERDRATTAAAESSENARRSSILAHLATTGAGLIRTEYLSHAPTVEFEDGQLTEDGRTVLETWRSSSPELFQQTRSTTSPLATGTTGAPGSDLTDSQKRGLERIGVRMGEGHWSTRSGSKLALDLLNHSSRNRD